jgi:hypothetical protein
MEVVNLVLQEHLVLHLDLLQSEEGAVPVMRVVQHLIVRLVKLVEVVVVKEVMVAE